MIYGIGVDIVEIARMRASYARFGDKLARRILAPGELAEFARARHPAQFLAMRFAAKEAASKALGTGFREGVSPRRIGVRHDRRGKPTLYFEPPMDAMIARHRIAAGHVSMSDEREYAIAYVVLETAAPDAGDDSL